MQKQILGVGFGVERRSGVDTGCIENRVERPVRVVVRIAVAAGDIVAEPVPGSPRCFLGLVACLQRVGVCVLGFLAPVAALKRGPAHKIPGAVFGCLGREVVPTERVELQIARLCRGRVLRLGDALAGVFVENPKEALIFRLGASGRRGVGNPDIRERFRTVEIKDARRRVGEKPGEIGTRLAGLADLEAVKSAPDMRPAKRPDQPLRDALLLHPGHAGILGNALVALCELKASELGQRAVGEFFLGVELLDK